MAIYLAGEELEGVMKVLQEASKTLEQIGTGFHRLFPRKFEQFKVAMGLCSLLEDTHFELLSLSQRLISLYLLFDLYKADSITNNPFCLMFIYLLRSRNSAQAQAEKTFIQYLLRENVKELAKIAPKDLPNSSQIQHPPPNLTDEEIEAILRKYYKGNPGQSAVHRASTSPLLDVHTDSFPRPDSSDTQTTLSFLQTCSTTDLVPLLPFVVRRKPSLMRPQKGEIKWVSGEPALRPVWDPQMGSQASSTSILRQLTDRACQTSLLPAEHQRLMDLLAKCPRLVHWSGLSPSRLPHMVDNNPSVAIAFLMKLMSSNQITEYLSVLVQMDMTLHSMEVVNRLTTAVELPKEFLHLYISNCISSCEKISDKDVQKRLVRLVCVFLQSLIRNKTIEVQDLQIEIQAFCIEFSRIKEAAGLFRLLKKIEQENIKDSK